jgi:hypothetical protein
VLPGPAPEGYYLDSIQLGNSPLAPDGQILSAGQTLTITYKHGGATVTGAVEACGSGEVILIPRDPALRNPSSIREADCGPKGKFEVLSVRPGAYYAFAIPNDDFDLAVPPDSELARRSTLLILAGNETTVAEIHLIQR